MGKSKGNVLLVVVAAVAVAAASVAGYLYFQSQNPAQPISEEEKIKLEPPADTQTWRSHSDSQWHITFKYPNSYSVYKAPSSPPNSLLLNILSDEERKCVDNPGACRAMNARLGILTIELQNIDIDTDLQDWAKMNSQGSNLTSILSNNLGKGVAYESGEADSKIYEVAFYDNSRKILVTFRHWREILSNNLTVSILSTFRFD